MFKNHDLQIVGLKFNKYEYFSPTATHNFKWVKISDKMLHNKRAQRIVETLEQTLFLKILSENIPLHQTKTSIIMYLYYICNKKHQAQIDLIVVERLQIT